MTAADKVKRVGLGCGEGKNGSTLLTGEQKAQTYDNACYQTLWSRILCEVPYCAFERRAALLPS